MSDKKDLKPYGEKQITFDKRYLEMALIWAQNSYCIRRQVGALIVKGKMIISDGYNGTPSGFENVCEDESNVTKPYVLHAEANAITKVAKSNNSSEDLHSLCHNFTLYGVFKANYPVRVLPGWFIVTDTTRLMVLDLLKRCRN